MFSSLQRVLLLGAFLVILSGTEVQAQGDEADYSSIGFFERMGTEAPLIDPDDPGNAGPGGAASAAERRSADQNGPSDIGKAVGDIVAPELDTSKESAQAPKPKKLARDEQLFESAMELYHALDHKRAISAFVTLLNYEGVRPELEKKALIYLARIYYQLDMPLRTISLLDLYLSNFPDDPRREEIIFQIGQIHRELGQLDAAIAAFYRVLNAIIMAGEDDMNSYLNLARKAQFEIARTHFDLGQWAQALDLFQRIALFELGPEDRETLRFYQARALLYVGRRGEGLREIEKFAAEYPKSQFLAELQYEKARTQIDMKQVESGRRTLMDLVEMGGLPEENMSRQWIEWRRIAGNFLANYYYKAGDFEVALQLYQSIVVMDESPRWQLPVVMQMAGCFRQLGQPERALESLEFIVQEVSLMRERFGAEAIGPDLEFLENSATWQLDLLRWRQGFAEQLELEASNI